MDPFYNDMIKHTFSNTSLLALYVSGGRRKKFKGGHISKKKLH
jgi:hypothetical protein